MLTALPFEWFVLLLRLLFIFLIYFFLFQVVRVAIRELTVAGMGSEEPVDEVGGVLVVREPGGSRLKRGDRIELDPVTLIGRTPRATIRLADSFVSGEHAQVDTRDGRWWLTDLQSTNGTLLNGHPVTGRTGLRYGDVISIGDVQLQLAR
ncbi:MAG TPA: FHA domain-containing protein [Nitrolancea sp.]|nr:FHA domain-containing protein [Nitrolancea sp.]